MYHAERGVRGYPRTVKTRWALLFSFSSTLAALAFRTFFRAGAAYYGLSDLERLQLEGAASDKLESGYMQQLIAPYPAGKAVFAARSHYSRPIGSARR